MADGVTTAEEWEAREFSEIAHKGIPKERA
jgi:hypothetical protein